MTIFHKTLVAAALAASGLAASACANDGMNHSMSGMSQQQQRIAGVPPNQRVANAWTKDGPKAEMPAPACGPRAQQPC
jgi:hypothetical protein